MNIIADKGVGREVVNRLRSDGHSVEWILESSPGIMDGEILVKATAKSALPLTEDKDFGELVYRKRCGHSGVVLLRLDGCSPGDKADIVANVINRLRADLESSFIVIDKRAVRIRRPPFTDPE